MVLRIPLFPLENVVLLPDVVLPLHVFEPRYRQLTTDALAGDRRIGMIAVRPEHAHQMAGDPPLYAVGCQEDHIAPWKAAYKIAGKISAPVRHTLTSSGHILGIINPPVSPPKRAYWTGETGAASSDEWLKLQNRREGSWWEDWCAWLDQRCGPMVKARAPGSRKWRALTHAPGTYVHEL